MDYLTKEDLRLRPQAFNAIEFMKTEEGKDKRLWDFINNHIILNPMTLNFKKYLRFYIFCEIMNWFIDNDFLSDRKGGERVMIASDLSAKIYLDMKEE